MPPSSIRAFVLIGLLVVPANDATNAVAQDSTVISRAVAVAPVRGQWRRTSQGWQLTDTWPSTTDQALAPPVASVHPLVLAALIGLVSIGGLLAFGTSNREFE